MALQAKSARPISLDGIHLWSAKRDLLFDFGRNGDTVAAGQTATIVGQYTRPEPDGCFDAGIPDNNSNFGFLQDGVGNRFDTLYLVDTNTGALVLLA